MALAQALGVARHRRRRVAAARAHQRQPAARPGRAPRAARRRHLAVRAPAAAGSALLRAARPRAARPLRAGGDRADRGGRRARASRRRCTSWRRWPGSRRRWTRSTRRSRAELVTLDDGVGLVEFTHPIARAAVYEALPNARRADAERARRAARAGRRTRRCGTAWRPRRLPDASLLAELEAHARDERARGSWSSAIESLLAASRLSPLPAERERLALEAIEATMYSGDGAAARRLASQARLRRRPAARQRPRLPRDLRRRRRRGAAAADPRLGGTRARRRRPALGHDRDAQRLPRRRLGCAAARPSNGRERADRARARRPRPRPAGRAVAGDRQELQRRPRRRPRRPRPLARRSAPRPSARAATSCSRSRASSCSRTATCRGARAAFEQLGDAEPRTRAARRRRAVALRPHLRAVPGGRLGRRRGLERAGDRAGGGVRRPVGDRAGALARELRAGRARRVERRPASTWPRSASRRRRSNATSPPR